MADIVKLITWRGENVGPLDDAMVYELAIGEGGVEYGCTITIKDSSTLHISGGHGVLRGRKFTVFDGDIAVQLSSAGELQGRVYIHMDLSNTTEPIQILTETGSTLSPEVRDADVNITNGTYDLNLYTFTVSTSEISGLVKVFTEKRAAGDEATGIANRALQATTRHIHRLLVSGWVLDSASGLYEYVLHPTAVYNYTPDISGCGSAAGVPATADEEKAVGLLKLGACYVEDSDDTVHLFAKSAPAVDFYVLIEGVV